MNRLTKIVMAVFIALCTALAGVQLCSAQAPPPMPEWLKTFYEHWGKHELDAAAAVLRTKAAENPPPKELPPAMFWLSRKYLYSEKNDEALAWLTTITKQFPDSPVTSLAWCGLGQVYGRLGEHDKMIAALERGILAPRIPAAANILDESGAHSYACETLGQHYIKNQQWDKALQVYTAWKPNSGCGTCNASMDSSRTDHLLLCLIHLGRHHEAVELAWRAVATNTSIQRLPQFVLARLYEEARQSGDMAVLARDLVTEAKLAPPATNSAAGDLSKHRIQRLENVTARMIAALELIKTTDWRQRLEALLQIRKDDGWGASLEEHVASWLLIRDPSKSVPFILAAAKADHKKMVPLAGVLAAIESPAARKGLVTLAVAGDLSETGNEMGHQQEICGLIRARVKDPDLLISEIQSRVPERRKQFVFTWTDPAPLAHSFFASWPAPKKGSLSKILPENVFNEVKAKWTSR